MQRGINIHKMKEGLLYIFTTINIYKVKFFIYGDSNSISKNFDIWVLKLKCFDGEVVLMCFHPAIAENLQKSLVAAHNSTQFYSYTMN